MKLKNHNLWIVVFTILSQFSFTNNNRTYQNECVSTDMDGYIILKVWDTKKGVKYTSEQARKDAIHAILFSGVSGGNSCTTQPPILNQSEDQKKFKSIAKEFFSKKGKWTNFSRSSTMPARRTASGGKGCLKIRLRRFACSMPSVTASKVQD